MAIADWNAEKMYEQWSNKTPKGKGDMQQTDWDELELLMEEWMNKHCPKDFKLRQSLIPIRDFIYLKTTVYKQTYRRKKW